MHMDPQIPNYAVRDVGPKLVDGFTGAIEPMVTLGTSDTRCSRTTGPSSRPTAPAPPTGSTPSPSADEGLWILTAIDGGEAALAARGAAYAPLA